MSASLQRLLPLFDQERQAGRPVVLATVVRTEGATYSKAGEHMLIANSGEYAGLLSGGCLEGDLAERAKRVLGTGTAELVHYDAKDPDDLLFGLGSGCEGAMDILLQRLESASAWQPMSRLASAWRAERPEALLLVVTSKAAQLPLGVTVFRDGQVSGLSPDIDPLLLEPLRALAGSQPADGSSHYRADALPAIDLLALHQPAPTRVLLLGAGPDAQPVAELCAFIGCHVTVVDHRSHYAKPARFPSAVAVLQGRAGLVEQLTDNKDLPRFKAAIVMSHHFTTDLEYLQVLAATDDIPYIGLLGPPARRERLLGYLGAEAERLRPRLHAPIGLNLGARSPESIALSIVAEIQAAIAGVLAASPPPEK